MTSRVARVPAIALVVAGIVTVAGLATMFVGGQVTGVSWDEPYRIGKLNNLFTTGWFVDDVKDGVPLDFNAYVYAPVSDLISHALGVLAGVQDWSNAAVTADAYAVRHLAMGLFALIAMSAAAAIAGLLLGSWRWAVVTAALLVSIPLWTGHGMFNTTDIPVAAGYTLVTLGAVLLIREQRSGLTLRNLLACGVALFAGITLSIGTRPATWPAIFVSLIIPLVAALALAAQPSRWRNLLVTAATVMAASVLAAVTLVVLYPAGFGNPLQLLRESVVQSAKFGGQDAAAPTTSLLEAIGYLPSWLAIQLPLAIGALFVIGVIAGLLLLTQVVLGRDRTADARWRALAITAVGAQLLTLPAGAALMRSNVYDGIRQFLFIVPMIAVVTAIGLATLTTLAARSPRAPRILSAIVWVLVALGLLAPAVDQLRLFPYNYAYVNEAAAREPINGRLPADYWRTSMRELIPRVPAQGATDCTFDPLILGLVPIDCANQGQLSPYWQTRGSVSMGVGVPSSKYLFLESNRGRVDPGDGCTIIDRVTRTLHGQEVVMSYVALCEAPCVVQAAAQCADKDMSDSNLDGWDLTGSNFSGADFSHASLVLTDFTGADLSGADLTGAVLDSANFTNADLRGADLTGANLTNATFAGADVTGAIGIARNTDSG